MRTHAHTTVWGSHIGMHRPSAGVDWLQRLRRWFGSHKAEGKRETAVTCSGAWDARREAFRPLRADSALDLAAAQGGSTTTLLLLYGML